MLSLSLPVALRPSVIGVQAGPSPRLRLHRVGSPGRRAIESFISAVYRERCGAELQRFAPDRVSPHDDHGDCVAAAGHRAAHTGPWLPEGCFSAAVESLSPASAGRWPVRRHVEVGDLAAQRGSYCDHRPLVLAGRLDAALMPARRSTGA